MSMWGPYRIDEELYDNAVRQHGVLESGQVHYKALDSGYPTQRASNCIHAVGSVAHGYRIRVLSPWFGVTASWAVLQTFRPHHRQGPNPRMGLCVPGAGRLPDHSPRLRRRTQGRAYPQHNQGDAVHGTVSSPPLPRPFV